MRRFYKKQFLCLNKKEIEELKGLTLRAEDHLGSEMFYRLTNLPDNKLWAAQHSVIRCREDKKTIAWAFLTECPGHFTAMFYVALPFRKQGIGKVLFNKARQCFEKPIKVFPWDGTSTNFFTKLKLETPNMLSSSYVEGEDRELINKG